jgi:hypothetical protein
LPWDQDAQENLARSAGIGPLFSPTQSQPCWKASRSTSRIAAGGVVHNQVDRPRSGVDRARLGGGSGGRLLLSTGSSLGAVKDDRAGLAILLEPCSFYDRSRATGTPCAPTHRGPAAFRTSALEKSFRGALPRALRLVELTEEFLNKGGREKCLLEDPGG